MGLDTNSIFSIIGSILGMLGSLIFILVYLFIKEIRDFSRKYIFTLSIYNFLLGLFAVIKGSSSDNFCKAQGFFLGLLFSASCSFIFFLALVYYLKLYHEKKVDESRKFFIIGNFFIFIIGLIVALIFIFFGDIDVGSTYWCWITNVKIEAVIYSIVWFSLLGTLVLYSITFFKIRKNKTIPKSFQYKIFALGWIYLLTELGTSIKRGRQLVDPTVEDNLFLDITQAVGFPMLGFWDSVFFVFFDKNVRKLFFHKKSKYENLKQEITEGNPINDSNKEDSLSNSTMENSNSDK
ncbi:g protein-coupled receptor [Anaeramoeba ignava]|uniref:G protein-coupled receptor n=1 Tax=Anaeramoeba ignava TaxID=1746090 RepID=A0A9Q0LL45_ANAIG|nr:g protein-coupled receptor [Anaeramoeba ignava]